MAGSRATATFRCCSMVAAERGSTRGDARVGGRRAAGWPPTTTARSARSPARALLVRDRAGLVGRDAEGAEVSLPGDGGETFLYGRGGGALLVARASASPGPCAPRSAAAFWRSGTWTCWRSARSRSTTTWASGSRSATTSPAGAVRRRHGRTAGRVDPAAAPLGPGLEEAEADERADGAEAVAPRDLLALGVGAAVVGDRDLVEADRPGRGAGSWPSARARSGSRRRSASGRARARRGRPCSRPPCRRSSCCRGRWRAASGSGCRRSARTGARAGGARRRAGGCRRRRRPCPPAAARSAPGCPTASTRGRRPGSAGCRRGLGDPAPHGRALALVLRLCEDRDLAMRAARRASSAGEPSVEPSSTSRISSVSCSSSSSSTTWRDRRGLVEDGHHDAHQRAARAVAGVRHGAPS